MVLCSEKRVVEGTEHARMTRLAASDRDGTIDNGASARERAERESNGDLL